MISNNRNIGDLLIGGFAWVCIIAGLFGIVYAIGLIFR